ncbi:ATP-binding protein [Desulfatitalea alkaliphila]|uniref:histidine kinase n=1 Tax=Desulfatitalea alkaliphila TaxID=2929485 RepID=A0AA41R206_9BACT|nr:ATP-binding protein [Desulfatitalea alkaliphila]MCJ8501482.1 response regulator [Desulfatitalea alkaliphila]
MNHILIVDDETPIRRLLAKILEGDGHACAVAADARQARELLAQTPFDLLLTDINMPGESGLDLARFVKETHRDTAIVFVSVMDDPDEARSALNIGAYGYLIKPFDRNQALITVGNALIRRQLEIEARGHRLNLENKVRERTAELSAAVNALEKAKIREAALARFHQDQSLFLQSLLEAIPSPLFYKDAAGVYQGCNPAFEQYVGRGRDRIVGRRLDDLFDPAVADHHHRVDQVLLQAPDKKLYEAPAPFADGTMREMLVSKASYQDIDGKVAGMVGVLVDITERKRMEQALRVSEAKYRTILENIGIGVALIDPEMRILELNHRMREWFPEIETMQQPICFQSLVTPPGEHVCGGCPVAMTLGNGEVHEAVLQRKTKRGERSLRIVSSAIRDDAGRIVAAIELVDDITEHMIMERELRQAQKLSSLGQLAAGVAHEINNPTGFVSSNLKTLGDYQQDLERLLADYAALKGAVQVAGDVAGLSDLIDRVSATEEEIDIDYIRQDAQALIAECREGTDRIRKIVDDLKHFAHPGLDQVQDTDINRELESTLSVVHNELKYKAEVVKELGDLPLIQANPQQLNQVFVNILVNAVQAIEKQGEIRVATRHLDDRVEIRIADTGCGIAEEHLNRIFDPFFTTKDVGQGTGLGMNIVYNIIQKHHGDIRVESRVGQGTTFIITLPVGAAPDEETDLDATAAHDGPRLAAAMAPGEPMAADGTSGD